VPTHKEKIVYWKRRIIVNRTEYYTFFMYFLSWHCILILLINKKIMFSSHPLLLVLHLYESIIHTENFKFSGFLLMTGHPCTHKFNTHFGDKVIVEGHFHFVLNQHLITYISMQNHHTNQCLQKDKLFWASSSSETRTGDSDSTWEDSTVKVMFLFRRICKKKPQQ
jgi:hypothetical protein